MTKSEKAVELFNKGYSCSQAVFSVFAEENGMDEKTAFRVSGAFGGGMARTASICGVVTGAMMAIGLKHGMVIPSDQRSKERTYTITKSFFEEFKTLHGSLVCKDLLGADISTPEGLAAAKPLHAEICTKLVVDAVKIVEKLI
jgi:C_GCAxxG_C_C family probable redox protein